MLAVAVSLGLAYFWYCGPPPYRDPGSPPPSLEREIVRMMSEVRDKNPDPAVRAKVGLLHNQWRSHFLRRELGVLGLAALPYVEEETRNNDQQARETAYGMLLYVLVTGHSGRSPGKAMLYTRYVSPIWERGLYDRSAIVRRVAIREVAWRSLGARGIPLFRRMLRDPGLAVRREAARRLVGGYKRPDLVPPALRNEALHGEIQ